MSVSANTDSQPTSASANVPAILNHSSLPNQSSRSTADSQISQNIDAVETLIEQALADEDQYELSIVMPCLNEADTLEVCIKKCNAVIAEHKINAEVIVADNGSTDGSIEIAERNGAKVVHVDEKGYGNALMGGIAAARGTYVIMGDADDSYDFLEVPKFVEKLREGKQLVQGCRLPAGGGKVMPGAMPFLHRWWGNPMFSSMVRRMFNAPINDVYCGLRGFRRDFYKELNLRCTGMEFATEMIIKSSVFKKDIAEVPITLHPDGRKAHAPHLRTFRDGWRTLRFFLLYSPTWLFQIPGLVMMVAGLLCYVLALPGSQVFGATLDAHTLLVGTLAILVGLQLLQFAIFTKSFATSEGLLPPDRKLEKFLGIVNLERGLVFGGLLATLGMGMLFYAFNIWRLTGFGPLNYPQTLRIVIPGVALGAIGFQTVFFSFFLGVLQLKRK